MEQFEDTQNAKFTCPQCGNISQDDVVFLCNTCEQAELIYKDGMYLCPSCLTPGQNFQCMLCDSKDVKMEIIQDSHGKTSSE